MKLAIAALAVVALAAPVPAQESPMLCAKTDSLVCMNPAGSPSTKKNSPTKSTVTKTGLNDAKPGDCWTGGGWKPCPQSGPHDPAKFDLSNSQIPCPEGWTCGTDFAMSNTLSPPWPPSTIMRHVSRACPEGYLCTTRKGKDYVIIPQHEVPLESFNWHKAKHKRPKMAAKHAAKDCKTEDAAP